MISSLLGVPLEDQEMLREQIETIFHIEPGVGMINDVSMRARLAINEYIRGQLAERRVDPRDDMLTDLTRAEITEDGTTRHLTDAEAADFGNLLVSAGTETVSKLLGWATMLLDEHRDQRAEMVADASLIPNAIEEILRYEAPSPVTGRWTTRDLEYHGVDDPGWIEGAAHRRFGEPRRASLPGRRPLRHPPLVRPSPVVRLRRALLHRCRSRSHGSTHRTRRDTEALSYLGSRHRGRSETAHEHRARLLAGARHRLTDKYPSRGDHVSETKETGRGLVRMDGKVALVIGAASGIGLASAEMCAEAGAQVMLADIDVAAGREAADSIIRQGGTASFTEVNASDEQSVVAAIAATVATFDRLQVLVNSAGAGDLHSAPGQAWHDFIDLFLKGPYYACLHAVDEIARAGGGSIVNVASIAGVTGSISSNVEGSGYGTAKHGLIGLTRTMALAYAKQNIRVNAVCPGYVKTAITSFLYADPETSKRVVSEELRVPMDRWGESREVGAVVAFLASDAASFITGQPIIVDGGLMAR